MSCLLNSAAEDTADFIYPYFSFDYDAILSQNNLCTDFVNSQYLILHRPLSEVLPISVAKYGYHSIPALYGLMDDSALEQTGILKTLEQPRLNNRGKGVLIGIADTGIDYRRPSFRNADGTTRILGLWDQTLPGTGLAADVPLDRLSYGTVYTEEQINASLQEDPSESPPLTSDSIGHGTRMAEIAAGSGSIPGAAPEASLVIVRLKPAKQYLRDFYLLPRSADAFQENDIMLGIKYLLYVARIKRMPIVILLGLGTNSGSHDGLSPLGLFLSGLASDSGQIIITAAGNETGRSHHHFEVISTDTAFTEAELNIGRKDDGFTMEFWANDSSLYTIGFLSPSGEEIARIPLDDTRDHRFSFLLDETVLHVTYSRADPFTGSEFIFIRFETPAAGLWRIRIYPAFPVEGSFHLWLPIQSFISESTFFLRPSPDTLVTEPGNAASVITAAAFNHRNNSIYIHSGRGYSRTGFVKPDLAAPGVSLKTEDGSVLTGTSAASALLAGAAAVLLSWAVIDRNLPSINTPVLKSIFIRGADRRPAERYPNQTWGYGSLNLYNAFLAMRE